MRVVVTGAGGFIGQHMIAKLAEDPDVEVVALVRSTPTPSSNNASHIAVDLSTRGWVRHLPTTVDVVVHLAQSRSHRLFPGGATDVYRVNVGATFELLEWARSSGAAAVVFASSGSVYESAPHRLAEGDPVAASSFYAASKIAGEALCTAYAQQFEMTILRFFGVYGPGSSDSVLPRLMQRIARGETIDLDGGIGLVTTPTFVSDCVDAIVRCIRVSGERGAARVLNVCGDEEISLSDACVVLGTILGREPHVTANSKTPMRLSGTNARARALLGWHPRHALHEGLVALGQSFQ